MPIDCSAEIKPCLLDSGRVVTCAQPPKGARELTTELAVWGREEEKEAEKPDCGREGEAVRERVEAARRVDEAAEGGREEDKEVDSGRCGDDADDA